MDGFFRSTVRASTREAAEGRLRDLYGDIRLGGVGGYAERAVGDADFTIAEVRLDGDFEVHAEVDTITFAFSTPGYTWRVGRDEADLSSAPAVFQPSEPMSSRIAGPTTVTTVNFSPTAMNAFASALYGSPTRVWFDGQQPASDRLGELWTRLVPLVRDGALLDNELTRAVAYHSLAATALESFRLAGDRRERALTVAAGRRAYARACRFIDDHLSLAITPADIARAAGVPQAQLDALFVAHSPLGWRPAEQLRRGRLAAAHQDLVDGDPTLGDTVSTIAARWGFGNPGRFAQLYRSVYGANPKSVLDR